MTSSVKISMPQFVWWMTNHSPVPCSLWEITSERIVSSLARPPAFRITCSGATPDGFVAKPGYVSLDMPGKVRHVGEHELEFR
jgi:hypothetical protein